MFDVIGHNMTKSRENNNPIDHKDVIYAKIETELS